MSVKTDVIVIGGGPAGSATATLAARAGLKVALFEKASFPRHHVGESLIPAVNLTLERLGIADARMEGFGFPRKHGVQFFSENGPSKPFYFSECSDERLGSSWQVLRQDFDKMMVDLADEAGVCSNYHTEVVDILTEDDDRVVTGVQVCYGDGSVADIEARAVVDASGVKGLLGTRFGRRSHIDGLQNSSVYAHYEDVVLDEGIDGGSTLIFKIEKGAWLWFIPIPNAVSIGLVTSAKRITSFGRKPEEILENAIRKSPHLLERMADAKRISPVRAIRDFSYHVERDGGPGWMLVGDARGFIDPMYSTGLFLSFFGAELAADKLIETLSPGSKAPDRPDFSGFSQRWQDAFDRFLPLVRAFYREDPRFRQFAKIPERRRGLVDLLTGLVETPEAVAVADELRSVPADAMSA